MPDKNVKVVIDGKPVLGPTGQIPSFHSDAIALSPDGEYLYYQPIAATTLYRVKMDALPAQDGKPSVEKYAQTFPVGGIWMDSKQNSVSVICRPMACRDSGRTAKLKRWLRITGYNGRTRSARGGRVNLCFNTPHQRVADI